MTIQQQELEREVAKLARDRSLEIQSKLDSLSVEFSKEIIELSFHIDKWRKIDRKPREVERLAYTRLLSNVPSIVLAESVIRAIFEAYLTIDVGAPLTYQIIVNNKLIQQRLRSILPSEETAVPVQYKFSIIDVLVSRTVKYLPSLFIDVPSKKVGTMDTIDLTESAQQRLGQISIQEVITDVPMHCPPTPWTSIFHGGFLTTEMQRGNPLIGSRYHDYKELIAVDKSLQNNPEILDSVNKMQSVAFKIDPNFMKYQKIIDDIRKTKIKELQNQIDAKREAILELEKQLEA